MKFGDHIIAHKIVERTQQVPSDLASRRPRDVERNVNGKIDSCIRWNTGGRERAARELAAVQHRAR